MFELAIVFTLAIGNIEVNRFYLVDSSVSQENLDYGRCSKMIDKLAENDFKHILREGESFVSAVCERSKFIER